MKKSTKVIATVVAVALVLTAMIVAIYAASAGKVGINANVSWTAQAGVDLEFWATANGGDEAKSIAKTYISPSTSNTQANIVGDLSCSFKDYIDDGVNNPNPIIFRYYIKNKSLTPLNVRVTESPNEGNESGTSAVDHVPKVELNSLVDKTSTLTEIRHVNGYNLLAGNTLEYIVTLSMASGGTGTINADTGLSNFIANVSFNFSVGSSTNGTISTSVDGASPSSVASNTIANPTLGDYLSTLEPAVFSGWFFDEKLTKSVTEDYLNAPLKDTSNSSFYCKTASYDGLTFTLNDDGKSYSVRDNGATGDIVIPCKYQGLPITSIPDAETNTSGFPFNSNTNITSIILPSTLETIGLAAFRYCSGLESISIPNTILTIGNVAFSNCSNLKQVNIPYGIDELKSSTFQRCYSLESIELPDSITTIGQGIFNKCYGLKTAELPSGLSNINVAMFQDCTALESIVIPSSVTSIGDYAFNKCYSLKEVNIPDGVISIGKTAFQYCESLTNITLPNTVTSMGAYAFTLCSSLTSINIPKQLTVITDNSFASCKKLKSIIIPKSVTTIGARAFDYCGLETITVESGNTKYDSRDNCNAIIETSSNKIIRASKNTIIPSSVTSIGNYAYSSSPIVSVTISNNITSIGTGAFAGCNELETITVEEGNSKYDSRNNCNAIIETATNKLISGCKNTIISNTITTIASIAFRNIETLKSITIPASVTSIGSKVFTGCIGLETIKVDSGNTIYDSRDNCNAVIQTASNTLLCGIKTTVIPSTVTKIGDNAFEDHSEIVSIEIPNGVTEIGNNAFNSCTGLEKIFIPNTVVTINATATSAFPFSFCSLNLIIYCEADSQPTGWGNYWNYCNTNSILEVHWGVTRAEFDAL